MSNPQIITRDRPAADQFDVLIAGAGVAGLEAAFALRELAGDRVRIRILAPTDEFVYRPMSIAEPFTSGWAQHYPLSKLAATAGAELLHDALAEVRPADQQARTAGGLTLSYDALLVCLGASVHRRFDHVTSVDDAKMDELLHGLVQDIEGGYVHRLAVVVPTPVPWPLPAYEIALMASERAWDTQAAMSVTVITPEEAPLALFGSEASLGMGRLLADRKIEIITSASCDIPKAGTIRIHPGDRTLEVDRIVALPELRGPAIVGLPHDNVGFIPIGEYAQVVGAERVWAAGDVADYPIKHGGVSAQMADTAARSIAALAGAAVQPQTFDPSLEGVVLTGGTPRYLRRRADGSDAKQSEMLKLKRGNQTPKIAARYLAPQLAALAPLTPQHPKTTEPVIAAR